MKRLTRRHLSGFLMLCALLGACGAALAAKKPTQAGVFALVGGTASTTAELRVAPATGGLEARVRLFTIDGNKPVIDYNVEMERQMHMIMIRDDFATFDHMHPAVDATTGTFHQTLKDLDPAHRYYLYADSVPVGMTQQVFRFNIQDENIPAVPPAASLAASPTTVSAGPYSVTLSQTTLTANVATNVNITIKEHGKPAGDLNNYLGAASHAVFINTKTLGYLHLHPTLAGTTEDQAMQAAMNGNPQRGPYQQTTIPALTPGSYKLWLQFSGGALKLYTAPFTLVVQ